MTTQGDQEDELIRIHVTKWLELNTSLKTLRKNMAEHKTAQKMLEQNIIKSMKDKDIPSITLSNGKSIILKTKVSKKSVTTKWIKDELGKCTDSSENSTKFVVKDIISKMNNPSVTKKDSLIHQ
jgi:hypothetical protein